VVVVILAEFLDFLKRVGIYDRIFLIYFSQNDEKSFFLNHWFRG
jgi:hypothetical protein